MPKYILLANFTDQGIRNIKGTIGRAEAFQAMAKKEMKRVLAKMA